MKKITFPAVMIATALLSGVMALSFALLHRHFAAGWLLSAAITFFTVFYHFAMRLAVGTLVPNRFSHRSFWFQPRDFEAILYEKLQVKKWKDRMPTYDPRLFSLKENTLDEIVNNMCQAEVVHEIIILLSFIPLLFSVIWDAFYVFFITSCLSALLDLSFVVMQRYNRPRILRLAQKRAATQSKRSIDNERKD